MDQVPLVEETSDEESRQHRTCRQAGCGKSPAVREPLDGRPRRRHHGDRGEQNHRDHEETQR